MTQLVENRGYPAIIDNPDDWAAFISRYLDNRATNATHNGIGLVALHIVDAIKGARDAALDRAERAEAEVAKAVAAERERCAKVADQVYNSLSASGADCLCGLGRVPVTAYRDACNAFAAAIRKGDAP